MEGDEPEGAVSFTFLHFKKVEVEVNDLIGVLNIDENGFTILELNNFHQLDLW